MRRDHATGCDHDIGVALAQKRRLQLRHERQMPGGQRGDAKDVDIVFDGLPRRFLGRGEKRPGNHFKAKVFERGSDDLLAAIMPILADFRDKNARRPPIVFLESRHQSFDMQDGRRLSA